MDEILLTLVVPSDTARQIVDLLLEHPELVQGFGSCEIAGHGSAVRLVAPAELVSGHAPRVQIQTVGQAAQLRELLDILRRSYPRANIFYWMVPALEAGRIG
ncbi:MAG: DUF3240 family protein [Rhodocyclaceae bacterium]|nr:DUF3240 family protein [Rhodocyclaceae bacterium]